MLQGGMFYIIWEADPKNLKVLNNSYYAQDRKSVFCRGTLLEGADAKTFMLITKPNENVYKWWAKDKYRAYAGEDVIQTVNNE